MSDKVPRVPPPADRPRATPRREPGRAAVPGPVASGGTPVTPPPAEPATRDYGHGQTLADAQVGAAGSGTQAAGTVSFRIVRAIGQGGMGVVSLAQDTRTKRWVALKRLTADFGGNEQLRKRFHAEGESAAALNHIHIVQVYTMTEDAEGPCIVMEYVPGPASHRRADWPKELPNPPLTLEERVKNQGVLDVAQTVALGTKLCAAVGYAHKKGIIHRDIKPANVLLNEEEEPKLVDFGLARRSDIRGEGLTLAGAQLLTLGYGAPEQEVNAAQVDQRADLYGLGGTLWFALTGQNPRYFRESEVPAPLRPLLVKALQKDREKRFQTAAEFEQVLAAIGQTRPAPAAPVPTLSPRGREEREGRVAPAQCPRCGCHNDVDPKKPDTRKFCEGCGVALIEPCLGCGAANTVWSRYCSSCGNELEVLVRKALQRWKSAQPEIETWISTQRLSEAIERLKEMAGQSHPRTAPFASWAKKRLSAVEAAYQAACVKRDRLLAEARVLLQSYKYAAVVRAMEQCPPPLRTAEMQELLTKSQETIAEMNRLRSEIKTALQEEALGGLLAKVDRYLVLWPGDEAVQQARAQLVKRERHSDEELWAVLEQGECAAYETYLAHFPAGVHANEARAELAAIYRADLLDDMRNERLRQKYLACRAQTPHLQKQDSEHAAVGVFLNYSLFGIVGGAIGGGVGAALYSANVLGQHLDALMTGLVTAVLGGLVSALLLGVRKL